MGGEVICFGELQGAGSCSGGGGGTAREWDRIGLGPWEESRGWSRVRVSARGWGTARRWSCACSASLSRGPRAGVALEQPQEHGHSPQSPTCPSQPGFGVPPTLLGLGGAPRAAACWECRWDPPRQRCTSGCLAHPSLVPCASWGTAFKFSLPKSYSNTAAPVQREHNPCEFPCEFPCEPSPASVCNYCAWQLLPSATALCRCITHPPRFPGIGRAAALPGGVTRLGTAGVGWHRTAAWPLDSQRVAPRHRHCVGTVRALHSPGTATAQGLHGLCVTIAWPVKGYFMASKGYFMASKGPLHGQQMPITRPLSDLSIGSK